MFKCVEQIKDKADSKEDQDKVENVKKRSGFELEKSEINEMVKTKLPASELFPIQFKHILMDINMTPGSRESI